MRAYILSIGSELLLGHITDTNATYLSQHLAANGIELIHVTSTGDDLPELVDTIRGALSKADLVICSGGIGPTDDDLTREAIAEVVGETPTVDPDLLDQLKSFFANRGATMPPRNAKQAWTIPSAEILPNPVGTAPGWFVTIPGNSPKYIVTMPGVPREMFRMWIEQAMPRILERSGNNVIDTLVIKTIGIGESAAEQELHELITSGDAIVATYAKDDGVHIMVSAVGDDPEEARARRDRAEAEVDRLLGQYRWGADLDTLERVLTSALQERGKRLSIIERGTGGAFAGLLARDLVSQQILAEGKTLPFDPALSNEEAEAAAQADAVSARNGNNIIGVGIAFSGEAGDAGVILGKVAIAVSDDGATARLLPASGQRATLDEIHRRAALHAVDMLRREYR
ncbi:MAG: CinA family nicotinamide mononucleotide deamidase-related protein [Thermomicrobiales bacterium]